MTHLVDHNEDLRQQMVDRLLSQFETLENWLKFVDWLAPSFQEAENVAYDLSADRLLDTAEGEVLDQYGALLDEPRDDLDDDTYSRVLNSRILSNRSSGVLEFLLEITARLANTELARVIELFPAGVSTEYVVPSSLTAGMRARIVKLLDRATSAAIGIKVVEAVPGYFGFEGDPEALGFGEGVFATRIDDNG